MIEIELIEAIRADVAAHGKATPAGLHMIEEGLKMFPQSARLWILRGDLIQLSDEKAPYSLDDVLTSYRTALEYEPSSIEAHESIGRFLDAVLDKPAEAEPYFRKAILLGGSETAEEGLAQVLEQLSRSE